MKIQVQVKPNFKKQSIKEDSDGFLVIRLKSPPVDDKANKELIAISAKKYQASKSQIIILSGTTNKHKVIEINKMRQWN
ncbi:hypothetical protein Xen7305DRAFT_00024920 [Xenococcus sp. PCC 7305]|uniref:DUF167 domain-containing protein n=1 Tax=Xenococcus sp. PCC 7305 TaxID=102125 RepID=UPI0002ABC16D|nr:DUF167 domain-containing protein [Xenococcus sp. PCC 7305]ELS02774.1 hypothetical protein Xen7305DRAFT_00024920 [Xenococcus sp. PCC 7305]